MTDLGGSVLQLF